MLTESFEDKKCRISHLVTGVALLAERLAKRVEALILML